MTPEQMKAAADASWGQGPVAPAERTCSPTGFGLCATHPSCDYVQAAQRELWAKVDGMKVQLTNMQAKIDDKDKELKARAEILDNIQKSCGEGWWSGATDWRQRLRDFAEDSEQHRIKRQQWKTDRGHGITLYSSGDFFTAYYDDAAEMWGQADDSLPMFHVMVRSDPPHRTCIHGMHLATWAQHCAAMCMPLQIMGADFDAD